MTFRQILLKIFYPLLMRSGKRKEKNMVQLNTKQTTPHTPFYSLTVTGNNGQPINLGTFKGKKILICNTASNCGYTAQYGDLEKLYEQFKDRLVVIGFPANDFKSQEPLDDEGIDAFCKINFGVTFPLAKKSVVIKSDEQNPVFNWLTHAAQNGWCDQEPLWNFCKYLVDEEGKLIAFFAHSVSPLDEQIISLL